MIPDSSELKCRTQNICKNNKYDDEKKYKKVAQAYNNGTKYG